MKFIIRTEGPHRCDHCTVPRVAPLSQFDDYVKRAVNNSYERVSLIRVYNNGQETVIDSWVRDDVKAEREIFKYKIHSLRTAKKGGKNQGNDVFYDTEAEAIKRAEGYATRSGTPQIMVIYKAIKIVRPADRPAVVEDVD